MHLFANHFNAKGKIIALLFTSKVLRSAPHFAVLPIMRPYSANRFFAKSKYYGLVIYIKLLKFFSHFALHPTIHHFLFHVFAKIKTKALLLEQRLLKPLSLIFITYNSLL